MASGAKGGKEKEAAEAFTAMLSRLDIPRVIDEMMNAVAFGFLPLEILWTNKSGRWDIADIVWKPPHIPNRSRKHEGTAGEPVSCCAAPPQLREPLRDKSFLKMLLAYDIQKNGLR